MDIIQVSSIKGMNNMYKRIIKSLLCAIITFPIVFIIVAGVLYLAEKFKNVVTVVSFGLAFILIVVIFYNIFKDKEEAE